MALVEAIVAYEVKTEGQLWDEMVIRNPAKTYDDAHRARMAAFVADRTQAMVEVANAGMADDGALDGLVARFAELDTAHGSRSVPELFPQRRAWIAQVTHLYVDLIQANRDAHAAGGAVEDTYEAAAQGMGGRKYHGHRILIDEAERTYFEALKRVKADPSNPVSDGDVLHEAQVLIRKREAKRIFSV
ncbi:MAG: hypothetical protein Q7S65_05140 [Nanoarchaeota archaeon]|nr:hypothetical protein [Nanoarchaeota archaeon]